MRRNQGHLALGPSMRPGRSDTRSAGSPVFGAHLGSIAAALDVDQVRRDGDAQLLRESARNVWDRAVTLLPRVDQLWASRRSWRRCWNNTMLHVVFERG